ncbi:MAG: hypothetical protein K2X48_12285 [Chitinophagaceae bacterium]|nr:hypothetical protein [Chitinophagaceae bacterium]
MDIEHPEFVLFLTCAAQNNLRYLCIGGYAVNYYGYHRVTEDMDIWIAPTVENKTAFINTLLCMGYTDSEIDDIRNEDFTTYFMCSLGARPHVIDVLTIVHKNISFDAAERELEIHFTEEGVEIKMVSYDFLKDIKLRSGRPKDIGDITMLEKLRDKGLH